MFVNGNIDFSISPFLSSSQAGRTPAVDHKPNASACVTCTSSSMLQRKICVSAHKSTFLICVIFLRDISQLVSANP